MENFSKLRARLGSVKLVLAQVARETHGYHSELQRKAVQDVLKACDLSVEERAQSATMVSAAGFVAKDEEMLLAMLAGEEESSSKR